MLLLLLHCTVRCLTKANRSASQQQQAACSVFWVIQPAHAQCSRPLVSEDESLLYRSGDARAVALHAGFDLPQTLQAPIAARKQLQSQPLSQFPTLAAVRALRLLCGSQYLQTCVLS